MTHFGKTSFLWLLAGSVALAVGMLTHSVINANVKRTDSSLQQLKQSEEEFARVKTQLAKWERAKASGAVTLPRVQPVALTAEFAPEELPGISRVLSGMYADHGFLNLKSFTYQWGTNKTVHMEVLGDKIFLH